MRTALPGITFSITCVWIVFWSNCLVHHGNFMMLHPLVRCSLPHEHSLWQKPWLYTPETMGSHREMQFNLEHSQTCMYFVTKISLFQFFVPEGPVFSMNYSVWCHAFTANAAQVCLFGGEEKLKKKNCLEVWWGLHCRTGIVISDHLIIVQTGIRWEV